jgi:hypothetical protein
VSSIRRIASDLRELRWDHVLVELVMRILGILIALPVAVVAAPHWTKVRRAGVGFARSGRRNGTASGLGQAGAGSRNPLQSI